MRLPWRSLVTDRVCYKGLFGKCSEAINKEERRLSIS